MEALNVVANIAAVIQLAVQVTQLSYSCAREIKNASKEQKQYLKEVSSLMDILFCVDEQIISDAEASRVPPPRPACLDDDALEDGHIQLSKLHFELEKRKSRLLRPFQDKELRPHINFLQKLRVTFSDYLSTCTLYVFMTSLEPTVC